MMQVGLFSKNFVKRLPFYIIYFSRQFEILSYTDICYSVGLLLVYKLKETVERKISCKLETRIPFSRRNSDSSSWISFAYRA